MKKRMIGILMALCMICSLLPTSAAAYSVTNGKHGSDFASGALADRLEDIFYNGISGCVSPNIPAIGGSLNNNQKYTTTYAKQSGSSVDFQCVAYARAAYSYLFGYNVGNSAAYQTSFYNAACGKNSVSYVLFQDLGIKCGAYMRTTISPWGAWDPVNGHSILILGYDSTSITTLEGNYTGNGRIGILNYTWNDFNARQLSGTGRYICSLVQPTESVYSSITETSLPTNFMISADKNSYSLGETVEITPSANNTTHYAISIWKGSFETGTRLYANFNLLGPITFKPTETGTYTVRADAKNSSGFISKECTFTVTSSNTLPTNFTVTTDKQNYALGETVTIIPTADNITHYAISVWFGEFESGQRLYVNYRLPGGITFRPPQAGTYTVRADAKNDAGFISKECTFTVTGSNTLPTNFTVTTDKQNYTLGETVTIIPTADDVTHYAISVWSGGFGLGQCLYVNYRLPGGITFSPPKAGTYTVRVDAKNDTGFISKECTFTVTGSNTLPTNFTVTTDKQNYVLGEAVTIIPTANNVTHYAISVWLGAFGSGQRLYVNYRLPGGITFSPSQAGTYTVRVDAKNSSGFISQDLTFAVN